MAPGLAVGGGGDNDSAPLNHRVTVHAAGSARLGQAPKDVPPRLGYGFGATFGRKLWAMGAPGAQVALWGNCELFHDRFSDHHGVAWDTSLGAVTVSAPGLLSQTSFVFLPVVAFDLGRVSPWVGAGLGFSLGYFHSAPSAYGPVTLTAHELVGRVAAGLDVALGRRFALGVRVGYSSALWPEEPRLRGPAFGTKELITFGPWVEAGLNFQFRF